MHRVRTLGLALMSPLKSIPNRRLASIASSLVASQPRELLGTLSLGKLSVPIYENDSVEERARLVHLNQEELLDLQDPVIADHLNWMTQKLLLGQDIFLFGAPGPFARILAATFAKMLNRTVETVVLHRDVGENELKQGRELREGGVMEFVDSAAVRAAKMGSILVLEGIERAERGVLPILNNLLENREMNLEDGTLIVSAERYALMERNGENMGNFIRAHPDFRVIAIGAPVPPYPGFPLDPPFRSRFQARYLDPLSSAQILSRKVKGLSEETSVVLQKVSNAVSTIQVMKEMRTKMASGVTTDDEVPSFPQTALAKLAKLLAVFPLPHPSVSTPSQILQALLVVHPALSYVKPAALRLLERAFEGAELDWTNISESDPADVVQNGEGILGWSLLSIERSGDHSATVRFGRGGVEEVKVEVAAGPKPFAPFPIVATNSFHVTPRFSHLLTSFFQLHALGLDISVIPPSASLQSSSSSTTTLIETFSSLLGYELSTVHLYKELGGRELLMRRVVSTGVESEQAAGTTSWEPAPLIAAAWTGKLVHLEGIDSLGSTVGVLAGLLGERQAELWEGKRLVGGDRLAEESPILSQAAPSFRVIASSSKSAPPSTWLTEELSAMFVALPTLAMSAAEESAILSSTNCPPELVSTLVAFARNYRRVNSIPGSKSRRLGTASLVRIAKRLARFPEEGLHRLLSNCLLADFLPLTTKSELNDLLADSKIIAPPTYWNPPAEITATELLFPAASDPKKLSKEYRIPLFDVESDRSGAAFVPYMSNYLDNSQQTALMRDIAVDLELGEHVLLLGNQGVGKNKIIDRLLMQLARPREYMQLHRDSTTQSLQFQVNLEGGLLKYVDSPLIRAVRYGRVIMIDEVDKAAPPVVAALASLASRGEMSLADGRKICNTAADAEGNDIVVHPNFRLILLGNRPGFPFLGNDFLRVLGDAFSCQAVANPDSSSEEAVLLQLAAEQVDPTLIRGLVNAFSELRRQFDAGTIQYPYSLRELLALVRHLKAFGDDEDALDGALRNIFDFEVLNLSAIEILYEVLRKNGLMVERIGIDAVRGGAATKKKPVVIEFKPTGSTELDKPKYGKDTEKAHVGGNTWAGGTGGRDTAGLGGRGGYMRLYKGHDINQVSQELKDAVPEEIKQQARDMARAELAKKLAELDLTSGQASVYSQYFDAVSTQIASLVSFLDQLEAKEEERVWLKRQSDGELDDSKMVEGLTGEASVYKRRGMEKPELGRPQLKAKRIRFIFDLSASMYRNQYDGRLIRSNEAATMVLESFARLTKKEKYRVDIVGHSGEEAVIPLVQLDKLPAHAGDRYKVLEKMSLIPQYAWSGDHTIEAIEAGCSAVAESDSDDYFVIVITDANFERYGISAEDLKRAMNSNPKVKTALIAIGEGAEASWLPTVMPGRAFRVKETVDIATTLRAILGSMLDSR